VAVGRVGAEIWVRLPAVGYQLPVTSCQFGALGGGGASDGRMLVGDTQNGGTRFEELRSGGAEV
jgi:hypothetical protein